MIAVSDAHKFDQFLKKLETTKCVPSSRPSIMNSSDASYDSQNETAASFNESRNESPVFNDFNDSAMEGEQHTTTNNNNSTNNWLSCSEHRQHFETRQSFVDRRLMVDVGSARDPTCRLTADSLDPQSSAVESFIERAHSGGTGATGAASGEGRFQLLNRNSDTDVDNGYWEGLPDAILKLDRRDAIPTPRHKNDVLVEIEASTVDRRDFMVRPGVRCTESLPQGITTTSMDCIGRIVQLTTHARAIYGLSIDDRVAAIYPFEYNDVCSKDKLGRRNKRYALVDAGFVVTVPKHVDPAEASCMVRLYLSAFQSIQKGMACLHDRYDYNQLKGQSILIQNGQTELGKVLIEMTTLLGASQIFATGEPEHHPLLVELGAIPLGLETFDWELFIEEKIGIVLVQDMPTAENFEQYISVLDETKGNLVYIHHGLSHIDGDDLGLNDLGLNADDVSCDGLHFHELAKKAKTLIKSAKFSLRLACSPKYIVYEGVWPSCKSNPSQFKEDLRYLFAILGRGSLKPNITECIGSEDVAGVQDRIELLGKKGTIVCLPTALYEKKIYQVVSPEHSPRIDRNGFPVAAESDNVNIILSSSDDPFNTYASDAGYVVKSAPPDTLSDFHYMHDARKSTTMQSAIGSNISMPALPESTSYSYSNSNHHRNLGTQQNPNIPPVSPLSMDGAISHSGRYHFNQGHYANDNSSLISSVGYSTANASHAGQTAVSDSVLLTRRPITKEDPPLSIQFHPREQTRRYRALRTRAKERRKRTQQQKKKNTMEDSDGERDQDLPSLADTVSDGSNPSDTKSAVSSSTFSSRRSRREARLREQRSLASGRVMEDISEYKCTDVEGVDAEETVPNREQTNALAASGIDEMPVLYDVDEIAAQGDTSMSNGEQTSAPTISAMDEQPMSNVVDADAGHEEAMAPKRVQIAVDASVPGEEPSSRIVDTDVVHSRDRIPTRDQYFAPAQNAVEETPLSRIADANAVQLRPVSNRRSKDGGQNIGHRDSRDEVDEGARDDSKDISARASSFSTLMQRWKTVENKNRNAWET